MKKWKAQDLGKASIHYVYTVFDAVALMYEPPICLGSNPEQTLRIMRNAAMNGQIAFPNDKHLIFLGLFDDSKGMLLPGEPLEVGSLAIPDLKRLHPKAPAKEEVSNDAA